MTHSWWQTAIFYQIYPRSFADSNGDGIGDIHGIIDKLDYLKGLGVGAIWLSPHYPSPLFDCGYDVADYVGVAPEYGTLDDFRNLLEQAHARNIRVVLDLVLNHTSHEHDWFKQSQSSQDNAKRDWYIWRDGAGDGQPPNNWQSTFGGSAWTLDPATGQYYYHFFLKEQPDLNWRNPEVKKAMFDAVRFWLDMGVDGFRLDAIGTIYEDPDLTPHQSPFSSIDFLRYGWSFGGDMPEDMNEDSHSELFGLQLDLPEVHDLMKELRQLVNQYPDRVLIGETSDPRFLGDGTDELHSVFNFNLMREKPLTADHVRANLTLLEETFPPNHWVCNTLNNHDGSRAFNRYTDGVGKPDSINQMKLATVTMLTLPGTPVLYNGEEIGMTNFPPPTYEQIRDYLVLVMRDLEREYGTPEDQIWKGVEHLNRDRCRTPMQWANSANAGFSPEGVETWLPVNSDYADGINVKQQDQADDSLLNFYRRITALRQSTPALVTGDFVEIGDTNEPFLLFTRQAGDQVVLVALNYSDEPQLVSSNLKGMLRPLWGDEPTFPAMSFYLEPYSFLIAEQVTGEA
jgi:alpha-glucosidase